MKVNELKVVINKPISEVFDFATDPANTPKWVESIVEEQIDEWPVKLDSIYKNQNRSGEWSEYRVTRFEKNRVFVLKNIDDKYSVEYIFTTEDGDKTKLVYRELVSEGELESPFTQKELNRLKEHLES